MMLSRFFSSISKLVFPKLCFICLQNATNKDSDFCSDCKWNMPYTNHFKQKENDASMKFWGRIPCEYVASFLNFYSYSDIRWMIHRIKYEGRKDIALKIGELVGHAAKNSKKFDDIDIIIPIPIHKSKLLKRGYNQSLLLAMGIGEALGKPIVSNNLIKLKSTESQTKKSRIERVKNVLDSFSVVDPNSLVGRHILIVDDVLTTGATIEASALKLLESKSVKISVLTACLAKN